MPLFDFYCKDCDLLKEELISSDYSMVFCSSCNSSMARIFPIISRTPLLWNPNLNQKLTSEK